jgi:pyruvate dehydrogenase E2 component (dihydrolipoamide acetyltransferase)
MIKEVTLPEISENVESGDVIKILVSVGDVVEVDQPLVEIETEKAVLEVPSPHRGKVAEILVRQGETIKVGQVFMTIDIAAVSAAETVVPKTPVAASTRREAEKTAAAVPLAGRAPGAAPSASPAVSAPPPLASPAVRRLARELGVDMRLVTGSGDGGRILEDDLKVYAKQAVEGAAPAGRTAPGPSAAGPAAAETGKWGPFTREPMTKVRQVTARSMAAAWTSVPRVTHYDKADITGLDAAQKKYSARVEKSGGKLTVTAVLIKVTASALKVFPKFNASIDIDKQEIVYKKYYHIGVAVDTDRGLLVPVIRDADRKNIIEISVELGALAEKARERKIAPDDLEGGTFTVSNLGGIGGTGFSPIVYAPQVAILGVARARIEPVYTDGRWEPRLMLPLSLSYDHRLIDGADAARFLRWIAQAIEDPILAWIEG